MSQGFYHKRNDVTDDDIKRLMEIFKRIHTDNVWAKVDKNDFITGRFEAGYINDICTCTLTEDAQKRFAGNCSPIGIVVKIFPKKPIVPMNDVHKGILCSMIANSGLGPRLIYMDQECSINEYIQGSRHYDQSDDQDDEFVKKVMRMLAQYHNLQVPISVTFKEGWLDRYKNWLTDCVGGPLVWNGKYLDMMDENPVLKPLREVYEKMDFTIIHRLAEAQHKIGSPLVLSHMDFHRLNRLVKESELPNGEKTKEFYFVDLDSSLYSYRGYDLGAFFDSLYATEPYFARESLARDDIILKFVEEYRQECARIVGKHYLVDKVNSPEQILREIKFFILNYSMSLSFFAASMFAENPKEQGNIDMMIGTHKRLILFQKLKKRFEEEGIIASDITDSA